MFAYSQLQTEQHVGHTTLVICFTLPICTPEHPPGKKNVLLAKITLAGEKDKMT